MSYLIHSCILNVIYYYKDIFLYGNPLTHRSFRRAYLHKSVLPSLPPTWTRVNWASHSCELSHTRQNYLCEPLVRAMAGGREGGRTDLCQCWSSSVTSSTPTAKASIVHCGQASVGHCLLRHPHRQHSSLWPAAAAKRQSTLFCRGRSPLRSRGLDDKQPANTPAYNNYSCYPTFAKRIIIDKTGCLKTNPRQPKVAK